jgi:hypothetical protein
MMNIDYYYSNKIIPYPEILNQAPEYALSKLTKKGYHKCWAHQSSLSNRFYMKSFFDFDFTILPTPNGPIIDHKTTPNEAKNMITLNIADMVFDKPVVQLRGLFITFKAPKTCYVEMQQSFYSPGKVITGKFDCHKWLRPVGPAFELEYHKRYTWTRETILNEICFYTDKVNEPIKLIEKQDENLVRESVVNSRITSFITKTRKIINDL